MMPTPAPTAAPRAWLYCRVSTHSQEDNGSLQDQEASCRRYAAQHGYTVAGVTHEVFTGSEMERPEMDAVLAQAQAGLVDVVVADKVDRFSRADMPSMYAAIFDLQEAGSRVEFVEVDPSNPFADMLVGILASLAAHERTRIVQRTQAGLRRHAEAGNLRFSYAPLYGYRLIRPEDAPDGKARYVVDEEAAAIVRRCLTAIAAGTTLRKLCKQLDSEGIETPARYMARVYGVPLPKAQTQAGWQTRMLARFYSNPTYWGERFIGLTKYAKERQRDPQTGKLTWRAKRTERQLGDVGTYPLPADVAPALVTKELAQAAKAQARHNYDVKAKEPTVLAPYALLRGMAYCGHCGSILRPQRQRDRHNQIRGASYVCFNNYRDRDRGYAGRCPEQAVTISSALLDGPVWEKVVAVLTDPPTLLRLVDEALAGRRQTAAETRAKRERLLKLAEDAETKAANYEESVGTARSPEVRKRMVYLAEEAHDEAEAHRREAARLVVDEATPEAIRAAAVTLADVGQRVKGDLATLSADEKRAVMRAIGLRVFVFGTQFCAREHFTRWLLTVDFAGIRQLVGGMEALMLGVNVNPRVAMAETLGEDVFAAFPAAGAEAGYEAYPAYPEQEPRETAEQAHERRMAKLAALRAGQPVSTHETPTEIAVEKNSTIIFPLPIDLVEPLADLLKKGAAAMPGTPAAPTQPAQPTIAPAAQDPQLPSA